MTDRVVEQKGSRTKRFRKFSAYPYRKNEKDTKGMATEINMN